MLMSAIVHLRRQFFRLKAPSGFLQFDYVGESQTAVSGGWRTLCRKVVAGSFRAYASTAHHRSRGALDRFTVLEYIGPVHEVERQAAPCHP